MGQSTLGNKIDEARESFWQVSKDIWNCPELAYEEKKAHDTLVRFFSEDNSWAVDGHYKLDTAFRASWERRGSSSEGREIQIGFLCEYDALPGMGHGCGHNLIAEVGVAAGTGLKRLLETLPDCPHVKITVLGTPAEEAGGGKVDMVEMGAFEGLDVVFMAHPSQEDATYLPIVAEHDVVVKYHGKAAHAAAYPWEGVNALDAAVLAYNNLSVLRQQLLPSWRVHGIIRHGGVKPNIIPDFTELEYYLRTPLRKDLPAIRAKAEMCFRAAAMATGCEVEVIFAKNEFHDLLRIPTLERLFEENGKALGMEFITDITGSEGSTDFGNVSHVVPGIHPNFYIGSEALNHTKEYTVAAGAEAAQFYTLRTAKALAMTALDVLFCPELMQSIKTEFSDVKKNKIRSSRLTEV
ncbi:peptidase M20 domain-containing protein 2-like [Engraulis encrasicolus]|uniref:peptidase M20 domain-containing protein 2-like n=1 Tax=Engraulis encrasicolus TaxID=184585 RepID=UPI002FCEB85D